MEPRIVKRDKKLILTYDLKRRVRCSTLLHSPAPNGATVIIYGHDEGLTVLWRGGRRLKQTDDADMNGDSSVLIGQDTEEQAQYEDEEELDPDLQYPVVQQSLDVPLEQAIVKIVPLQATEQYARSNTSVRIAVATLGGRIQLLTIPLHLAPSGRASDLQSSILETAVMLKTTTAYVRCLAAKTIHGEVTTAILAAVTDQVEVWQISEDGMTEDDIQYSFIATSNSAARVAFRPGMQDVHLLVTDKLGSVSVYDLAAEEGSARSLYTLTTGFEGSETLLPTRKRLVDAQFILNGRCVIALAYDGQWGIWDTTTSQPGKGLADFVLRGFLDGTTTTSTSSATSPKRTTNSLTPMTPNTRKTKSETFFATPQTRREYSSAGGITVSKTATSTGVADESVMIWYQGGIYTIPSVQAFWQRSTSGSSGLGSLHTPGIASISGVNLFNECITSLCQLPASTTASGLGQLKTQRDFVVSTEHRLVIVQSRAAAQSAFTQALVAQADSRDQRMLDAGQLDIGGMDRMLDVMNDGRSRKVGFAH